MNREEMYLSLGVSDRVLQFGEAVLDELKPRFAEIDEIAELNQAKVIAAMQKNRVNATHFAASTGYGYDDEGRDNLERVYASAFHTEAALVRPQITCGTHALAIALSANLLPGDELLAISGKPYDQHRNTSWTAAAYSNNTRSVWRISPSFIPLEDLRKHTGITIFCFHSCSRCLIFLLSIIFHKLYRLRILIQKFNDLLRVSCRNCFLSYPCNSLLCRLCLLSRI